MALGVRHCSQSQERIYLLGEGAGQEEVEGGAESQLVNSRQKSQYEPQYAKLLSRQRDVKIPKTKHDLSRQMAKPVAKKKKNTSSGTAFRNLSGERGNKELGFISIYSALTAAQPGSGQNLRSALQSLAVSLKTCKLVTCYL